MQSLQERELQVTGITANPKNTMYGSAELLYFLIERLKNAGIYVKLTEDETGHFAVLELLEKVLEILNAGIGLEDFSSFLVLKKIGIGGYSIWQDIS